MEQDPLVATRTAPSFRDSPYPPWMAMMPWAASRWKSCCCYGRRYWIEDSSAGCSVIEPAMAQLAYMCFPCLAPIHGSRRDP